MTTGMNRVFQERQDQISNLELVPSTFLRASSTVIGGVTNGLGNGPDQRTKHVVRSKEVSGNKIMRTQGSWEILRTARKI
jgi:hypothetical protein